MARDLTGDRRRFNGRPAGALGLHPKSPTCPACCRAQGRDSRCCWNCGETLRPRKKKATRRRVCPHCDRSQGRDYETCRHCGGKLRERKKIPAPKTTCKCGNRKKSTAKQCRRCYDKRPLSKAGPAVRFRRRYRRQRADGTWEGARHGYARARRRGLNAERIDALKVFERDSWRCQICFRKTPKRLRGTQALTAPELDHRIPLAMGGGHTWDNVQCACRRCNMEKSGSVARGQYPLFARPA